MPWQKLNPSRVDDIVERHKGGESTLSLATEFGVSTALISHHLRQRLGPRSRGKLLPSDRKLIVDRWKRGEVAADLAREFGVGFSSISKLIYKETGKRIGRVRKRNEVVLPEDRVKLAYLAALIDAEGCISRNTKVNACTWQVTITNTSVELEAWLRPLGGAFYYVSRRRMTDLGHVKQCFEWKVTTAWNIYRLLVAVLPFLVIKRDRAMEALEDIRRRFGFEAPLLQNGSVGEGQLALW